MPKDLLFRKRNNGRFTLAVLANPSPAEKKETTLLHLIPRQMSRKRVQSGIGSRICVEEISFLLRMSGSVFARESNEYIVSRGGKRSLDDIHDPSMQQSVAMGPVTPTRPYKHRMSPSFAGGTGRAHTGPRSKRINF